MNKMMKRIVSMMLAVVMCFGLVDVRAFAEEYTELAKVNVSYKDSNWNDVAAGFTFEEDWEWFSLADGVDAPDGFVFKGWKDGSNNTYAKGAKITWEEMKKIVGDNFSREDGSAYVNFEVVFEEEVVVPATKQVYVTFVDMDTREFVWAAEKAVEVSATATQMNTSLAADQVPAGYVLAETGDVVIDADNIVKIGVRPEAPATKQIFVKYVDRDGKFVEAAGKTITVEATATSVSTSLIEDQVPEGYVIAIAGDVVIGGEYNDTIEVVVEKEVVAPATKQIFVNYVDRDGKFVAAAGKTITVEATATSVSTSLTEDQVPAGYVIAIAGDMVIGGEYNDTIEVVVEKEAVAPATKQIFVNYVDRDGKFVAAAGKTITVEATATSVSTSLTEDQVPEGYVIAIAGDMVIGGEYNDTIEVVVEKEAVAPATKQIFVKFVDEEGNHVHTAGKTIVVDADVTYAHTSLTEDQVPAGYEIAIAGDIPFGGEYGDEMVVVVRKADPEAPATKQIYVVYNDEKGNFVWAAGKTLVVAADATYVNTSVLEEIPAGYELALIGDLPFDGDMLYVTVRKVNEEKPTKQIYVVFEDRNGEFVEALGYTLVVDADATYANTSILNYVPENYKIAITGDITFEGEFNDMMYVTVEKVEVDEDGDDEVVVEPEKETSKKKTAKAIPDTGAMDYTGFVVMVMAAVVLFVVRKVKA